MQPTFSTLIPLISAPAQSLPICYMLQAQDCKTKIVRCKQQPRNNIQFRHCCSTASLQHVPPQQQRELNSHHCRRAWLKPAEIGQGFSPLGTVTKRKKNNKEVIAFLQSMVLYTRKANTVRTAVPIKIEEYFHFTVI